LYSAPRAPRCSRRRSAVRPRRTISWSRRPARSATSATPHASCSFSAEYKPAEYKPAEYKPSECRPAVAAATWLLADRSLVAGSLVAAKSSSCRLGAPRRLHRDDVFQSAKCRTHPLYRSTRPIGGDRRTGTPNGRAASGRPSASPGRLQGDIGRPGHGSDRTQRRGRFSHPQASHAVRRERQRKSSEGRDPPPGRAAAGYPAQSRYRPGPTRSALPMTGPNGSLSAGRAAIGGGWAA